MKKGTLIGVALFFLAVPGVLFGQALNFQKTQVTTGGTDETPAWSPNAEKIAFASNGSGNYDIYVVNTNGTGRTQLTSNSTDERYPSWNPAGTQIAYIVRDTSAGEWGPGYFLYTMDADGSGKTLHPLPPNVDQEPTDNFWVFEIRETAWSPDGTSIAFVSYGPDGGYNKIYQYHLSNNQVSEITPAGEANPFGMIFKISWCGTTNLIAFDRWPIGVQTFTPGTANLQVLNIPTLGEMDMDTPTMPGWNSSGTKIAYVKGLFGGSRIGIFDLATEINVEEATPGNYISPVWSPDGRKIAVTDGGYGSEGNILILTIMDVKNDFNADGKSDLFWRNPTTGENVVYYMDGVNILGGVYLQTIDSAWTLAGIADLNSDNKPDLLWRNPTTGENVVYYMNGVNILSGVYLPTIDPAWTLSGTADLNSDGKPDFLWRNPVTGENVVYFMDGVSILSGVYLPTIDPAWSLAGTADLNADGKPDFLWRNPVTGENVVYYMNGITIQSGAYLPTIDPAWTLAGTADLNADGKPDFIWRNPTTGENVVYYMNGVSILSGAYLPTIDPAWILAGH